MVEDPFPDALDAVRSAANMAEAHHQTLGDSIRAARTDKGMKLRELARRVDRTPSYISDIENDRRIPSEDVLRHIAEELDLDFEELMARAGRFGSDAERYLRRSPAATTLFRRIQERNLNDAEIRQLMEGIDDLRPPEGKSET
jgi:transcriptional regulator with XRE-family HTH domain